MDLLLEDPPAVSAPFTPKISHIDVVWVNGCATRKMAWTLKSRLIEFESDREAEAMQHLFDAAHNRGDDMPCPDESAESAIEGPHGSNESACESIG